jgi:hypothetical protein
VQVQVAFRDMDLLMENDYWKDLHDITGQPVGLHLLLSIVLTNKNKYN